MTRKHKPKMFRTIGQRLEKWDRKLNPHDYAVYLEHTKPLARDIFLEYQAVHESLISMVRDIVSKYGSEGQRLQTYMWFAQGCWYLSKRYRDNALKLQINALFFYYVILGLNVDALKEIACRIAICPDPPHEIVTNYIGSRIIEYMSESIYIATKKAIEETILPIEKDPDVYTNPVDINIQYTSSGEISSITIKDKQTGASRTIVFKYDQYGNLIGLEEV